MNYRKFAVAVWWVWFISLTLGGLANFAMLLQQEQRLKQMEKKIISVLLASDLALRKATNNESYLSLTNDDGTTETLQHAFGH